jgi:hypothetical protein
MFNRHSGNGNCGGAWARPTAVHGAAAARPRGGRLRVGWRVLRGGMKWRLASARGGDRGGDRGGKGNFGSLRGAAKLPLHPTMPSVPRPVGLVVRPGSVLEGGPDAGGPGRTDTVGLGTRARAAARHGQLAGRGVGSRRRWGRAPGQGGGQPTGHGRRWRGSGCWASASRARAARQASGACAERAAVPGGSGGAIGPRLPEPRRWMCSFRRNSAHVTGGTAGSVERWPGLSLQALHRRPGRVGGCGGRGW